MPALAIVEALGVRFCLGFASALYLTSPGFRHGINEAIGALLP